MTITKETKVPARTAIEATATQRRLAELRELAATDPTAAQDAAWAGLQDLGSELPGKASELALSELFAAGKPADVNGQTEGLLVGWPSRAPDLDAFGRLLLLPAAQAVTRVTMPWLGKKFDQAARRGTNSVNRTAMVLTRLLAPGYRMRRAGDHWEGFDMLNRVEESVVSPGTHVLVLDYESPEVANPFPINRIRDEAVQLVPGTYLGAKLWHQADGYRQLAYWVAKAPV
jgi:hypothetical protein